MGQAKWIDIKVSRPDHNQEVYITDKENVSWVYCAHKFLKNDLYFFAIGIDGYEFMPSVDNENVTHWMPAPSPSVKGLR